MQTAAGRVTFLAVGVRPGTGLAEAHDLASRLEGDYAETDRNWRTW